MQQSTLIDTLIFIFQRDLTKLITEIELYKKEENIWLIEKNISNSAGNLALHLVGNLNTYIGKEIGGSNYTRNRDLEFSQKDVPRQDLIQKVADTIKVVSNSLTGLTNEDLQKEFPVLVFSEKTSTEYMLVHLATHLTYHLGQVNYHRRLIDE